VLPLLTGKRNIIEEAGENKINLEEKIMKAIVYTKYGPPEVLELKEVEKPVPKDNEVSIRVRAVEATKSDCEMRSFNFQVKWFWLPLRAAWGFGKPRKQILGGYFSGEVESAGKEVSKFKKGDHIFGAAKLRLGAYGEYVCLPAGFTLVPKPVNVTFAEAAAIPLGGLNALHFLRRAKIQKGEKVLVNGAGGSIGTYGIQIAKALGAEVTAVDSGIKEEMLHRIGADHFIDYAKEDFAKSGPTYDVIFSMVARCSYSKCIKALKPGGRYLMANPRFSDMWRSVLTSAFTGKTAIVALAGEKEEELLALKEMIEEGKINAVVDKVFPLEQAVEAHRRVENELRLGPVVISMGES
jgi:NADPH:quinone reductase-like Zn-dependent oxidoreductase